MLLRKELGFTILCSSSTRHMPSNKTRQTLSRFICRLSKIEEQTSNFRTTIGIRSNFFVFSWWESKDGSNLIPPVWGDVKAILIRPCFHVLSLRQEAKNRLSRLQQCIPALTPWKEVLLEFRLAMVGMIRPGLGLGLLQARVVHKPWLTPKKSTKCKKNPLEFGSNFELISKGCSFS